MEKLRLRHWESAVLIGTLVLCALLRLWPLQFAYYHPDEVIAVEVARHVVETGSLDTNWKNVALPVDFKLPQYNFSAYNLSAAAIDGLWKTLHGAARDTLAALRFWSAILAIAAAALTFLAGRRLFGTPTALVAMMLVTVNPLLTQDAFYARPEAFVTALTLVLVLGSASRRFMGAFLIAVAAGVLIATKITMVALLPLLFLPENIGTPHAGFWEGLLEYARRAAREFPRRLAAAAPGVAVGVAVGAPFAFVNPHDYLQGVAFLVAQYAAPQWPYGLGEASVLDRLGYVARYFAATTGAPVLLLSLAGAAWAAARQNFRALGTFLCISVFAGWFATMPTFFERNFSHLMPVVLMFAAFGLVEVLTRLTAGRAKVLRPVALAVLLIAALAPALRTSTLLLADEVSGKSREELRQLRLRMVQTYGSEVTPLSADENYASLGGGSFHTCGPWLIEIIHFHSDRSDAALPRVTAATGFAEVGRYVSKFAYVPTSSLHTYVTPTIIYLFRDGDPASCEARKDVVDPRDTGAPLDVLGFEADAAWTERGAFPSAVTLAPARYFGSWSGADANKGTIRMTLNVEGQSEIVIPYATGPSVDHQSIRVTDKGSGQEIWKAAPPTISPRWTYLRIALPPGTREIVVEAADNGADWGQWHALAPPHALKSR